jgi:hypothetical protein
VLVLLLRIIFVRIFGRVIQSGKIELFSVYEGRSAEVRNARFVPDCGMESAIIPASFWSHCLFDAHAGTEPNQQTRITLLNFRRFAWQGRPQRS